jgi:hypothetical protein
LHDRYRYGGQDERAPDRGALERERRYAEVAESVRCDVCLSQRPERYRRHDDRVHELTPEPAYREIEQDQYGERQREEEDEQDIADPSPRGGDSPDLIDRELRERRRERTALKEF